MLTCTHLSYEIDIDGSINTSCNSYIYFPMPSMIRTIERLF